MLRKGWKETEQQFFFFKPRCSKKTRKDRHRQKHKSFQMKWMSKQTLAESPAGGKLAFVPGLGNCTWPLMKTLEGVKICFSHSNRVAELPSSCPGGPCEWAGTMIPSSSLMMTSLSYTNSVHITGKLVTYKEAFRTEADAGPLPLAPQDFPAGFSGDAQDCCESQTLCTCFTETPVLHPRWT